MVNCHKSFVEYPSMTRSKSVIVDFRFQRDTQFSPLLSNSDNQNSSSSVVSSGYNSSHSRKEIYLESTENNENKHHLEMKSFINIEDGSNLTEISPVLTCIRTLNESEALWDGAKSCNFKSVSLKQLKSETDVPKEDGFYFAVSLRDGSCLYTSSAITDHLGYPKDMFVGQCIMNFLYHKDHITFANHLTQGLNACFIQGKRDDSHLVLNTFFCRLRVYQSLKFGYAVSEKKPQYKPFKITLHINELIVDDMCVEKQSGILCVKATATNVSSAYTVPEEIPAMTSFSTRHTASCHFSHVDASAIPYLGYLPQDMIGYSVFDFYHTDDMPQLKDIYELVIKEHGSSFRSKPYRFKVHNGSYVLLETEWSCFINPWSHKLEFVVGQHRVLKGPSDINIFTPCEQEESTPSDAILKESQCIQKEIKALLSQCVQNLGTNKAKRFCNKRKRDLASFVYNCIDENYKGNKQKAEKLDMMDDCSNSDPDSVVMGDISPYRDVIDSSVSSETPPTVQQLRYQENIERFFASQPTTYSDGSEEFNKNEKFSSGEDYQGSSSGSGNGSGKVTKSQQSPTTSYENKIQESSSNSSKCNMSSFTTGDSGYGKSLEKDGINDPCTSQASSCNQTWKKNSSDSIGNNVEKFSTCLALTEETLSVHNRMQHKHLKQHQRKNKVTLGVSSVPLKDNNWFQQKESGHVKHKKCSHSHNLTASTPTQTDLVKVTSASQSVFRCQASVPSSVTDPHANSICTPNISHPCIFPPNNCTGSPATPTPFFIPVVYMGSMPYYPPLSTVHPQTGGPFWPCSPSPSNDIYTGGFPFPVVPPPCSLNSGAMTPPCSVHSNTVFPAGFPYPAFPAYAANSNCNALSGNPYGVRSSGVTTTTLLTTTTTTVASGSLHTFKNTVTCSVEPTTEKQVPKLKDMMTSKKFVKTEVTESDMQIDDTQSSFTQSSSFQSADKDEDMDIEMKKNYARPPHPDKIKLSADIAYRYQMNLPNVDDVLKKDMEALKSMHQPELVNKQLQQLQNELKDENDGKAATSGEFCMTEAVMLGFTTEDEVNEELEYREASLLQLMCEDS